MASDGTPLPYPTPAPGALQQLAERARSYAEAASSANTRRGSVAKIGGSQR